MNFNFMNEIEEDESLLCKCKKYGKYFRDDSKINGMELQNEEISGYCSI